MNVEHQYGGVRERLTQRHILWLTLGFLALLMGVASVFVPPVVFIAGVFLIVGTIILIKYPFIGTLLYMVTFVLRPGEMYPPLAALSIERIIGVCVLIVALFHYKHRHGTLRLPTNATFMLMVAFLAVMVVSWGISVDPARTQNIIVEFLKLIVLFLIVVYTVDTKEKLNIFMGVFVLLMAREAFFSFRDYYGGGYIVRMGIKRAVGRGSFGSGANSLAATLVFTIPFAYAFFRIYKNMFIRLAALGTIGLCLLMTVNTGSRGGLLALVAALGVTIWYSKHRVPAALLVVFMAVVGWFALPQQYQDRYLTLFDEDKSVDDISTGRVEIWENGLRMFAANPVLGIGAGAFLTANASGDYGEAMSMNPHSIYVQLLATVGIVGFLVWFGFQGSMIVLMIKERLPDRAPPNIEELYIWYRYHREAIITCTASLLVAGLFAHSLLRFNWYINAAVATALITVYRNNIKRELEAAEVGMLPAEEDDNNPPSETLESKAEN